MPLLIGFLPAAIGFFLMRALGSGSMRGCRHDVFRLIMGMGIGLGLSSECYFIGLVSGSFSLLPEMLLLLLAAALAVLNRKNAPCVFCESISGAESDLFLTRRLLCAFGLLLLADFSVFAWMTARTPRGGWDAWAIWNLRARFLYRAGGAAWRDAFTQVLDWSHPDYPLLLPASVARGWRLLGRESGTVPIALACFFTFGTPCLVAACIATLRGARQGILAGLALAATPFFYVQGAMQCADVPVAFYRLASLGGLALADRFSSRGLAAIAGLTAALGAWTKNEGLLWFVAFLLARGIVVRGRLIPEFLAGAVPVLAPVVFFKARVATSSDIFGATGRVGMMARALDPARYTLIARETVRHVWNFGPLLISAFALLIIYIAVTGLRRDTQDRAIVRTGALALLFTAFGYFMIYLLRSRDLQWLLDTSVDRLLLQLWPSIVFMAFLACRAPGCLYQLGAEVDSDRSSSLGSLRRGSLISR